MKKISDKVSDIVKKWQQPVEILPGLSRNQYEIIKRIYFYRHNQFIQCTDDKAIFWQVVSQYIPHFSKLIDLDPKDLRPTGQGDTNYFQAWALRRKLQAWVEENNFGVDIDDLTKLVSSFGSYIWKVVETNEGVKVEPCDLRNVYLENPTTKTLRNCGIVELHYLDESEIKEKDGIWDNIEDLIKNAKTQESTGKKEIWEYWGNFEYKEGKYQYVHKIGAGYGDKEIIAFEDNDMVKEDNPYYDFHLYEFDGTWLRKGNYETCFPEQERANTIVNENAQATAIASLLLLRTQDPNTTGNVLQQAISGQIINSADLQQIGIDNRAFTMLLNELEKIERQVQKKLMLPDIATGETLPSGTPFRGMAVMSNAYKSAFKQIRSRVASGIVDVLLERILPDLVKKWNRGEIIEIAEDVEDVQMYDKALKTIAKKNVLERANTQRQIMTPEVEAQIDQMVEESIKMNGRKIETEKGFFNFKYGIVLDPVGETYDKSQQNDAIINAITMTMQNPAISGIPAFKQLLENNGIAPFKLSQEEQQQIQQMGQPQGGQAGLAKQLTKAMQPVDTANV